MQEHLHYVVPTLFLRKRPLKEYAVKATQVTLDGQHESGGWSTDFKNTKDAKVDLVVSICKHKISRTLLCLGFPILKFMTLLMMVLIISKGLQTAGGGLKVFLTMNHRIT